MANNREAIIAIAGNDLAARLITDLLKENDQHKKEITEQKDLITHLKLYPGADFKDAVRDFHLLSRK